MLNFMDVSCDDLRVVISLVKAVVALFQIGIPILLIVFGLIDLGKAVIASKEDEMKKAQGTLIKRLIYAVAVFLVVTIVTVVLGMIGQGSDSDWYNCYKNTSSNTSEYLNND